MNEPQTNKLQELLQQDAAEHTKLIEALSLLAVVLRRRNAPAARFDNGSLGVDIYVVANPDYRQDLRVATAEWVWE